MEEGEALVRRQALRDKETFLKALADKEGVLQMWQEEILRVLGERGPSVQGRPRVEPLLVLTGNVHEPKVSVRSVRTRGLSTPRTRWTAPDFKPVLCRRRASFGTQVLYTSGDVTMPSALGNIFDKVDPRLMDVTAACAYDPKHDEERREGLCDILILCDVTRLTVEAARSALKGDVSEGGINSTVYSICETVSSSTGISELLRRNLEGSSSTSPALMEVHERAKKYVSMIKSHLRESKLAEEEPSLGQAKVLLKAASKKGKAAAAAAAAAAATAAVRGKPTPPVLKAARKEAADKVDPITVLCMDDPPPSATSQSNAYAWGMEVATLEGFPSVSTPAVAHIDKIPSLVSWCALPASLVVRSSPDDVSVSLWLWRISFSDACQKRKNSC